MAGAGGDFNADGIVDGADLAVLKMHFGLTSGAMPGDGDADGDRDVDGVDFLAWQRQVGAAPGVATAVAAALEPTTRTSSSSAALSSPVVAATSLAVSNLSDLATRLAASSSLSVAHPPRRHDGLETQDRALAAFRPAPRWGHAVAEPRSSDFRDIWQRSTRLREIEPRRVWDWSLDEGQIPSAALETAFAQLA